MKHFLERLVVSSLAISTLLVLFFFVHVPFVRMFTTLLVMVLAAIALWEFVQFAKAKGWMLPSTLLIGLGMLVSGSFLFSATISALLFFAAVILLFAFHFPTILNALEEISLSVFGLLYIALPLGMMLGLLFGSEGLFWVMYLIAVTKSADIGGYMGGTLWGKRRLAPLISPSKTIAGAACGLLCSLSMSFVFGWFGALSLVTWVGLGIGLGCMSIFSDLVESLLKRDAGKKDSNVLPGLGGILDMLDSLLLSTPLLYFLLRLNLSQ
jgi:phosphatidate cytidylyltransferase